MPSYITEISEKKIVSNDDLILPAPFIPAKIIIILILILIPEKNIIIIPTYYFLTKFASLLFPSCSRKKKSNNLRIRKQLWNCIFSLIFYDEIIFFFILECFFFSWFPPPSEFSDYFQDFILKHFNTLAYARKYSSSNKAPLFP